MVSISYPSLSSFRSFPLPSMFLCVHWGLSSIETEEKQERWSHISSNVQTTVSHSPPVMEVTLSFHPFSTIYRSGYFRETPITITATHGVSARRITVRHRHSTILISNDTQKGVKKNSSAKITCPIHLKYMNNRFDLPKQEDFMILYAFICKTNELNIITMQTGTNEILDPAKTKGVKLSSISSYEKMAYSLLTCVTNSDPFHIFQQKWVLTRHWNRTICIG